MTEQELSRLTDEERAAFQDCQFKCRICGWQDGCDLERRIKEIKGVLDV